MVVQLEVVRSQILEYHAALKILSVSEDIGLEEALKLARREKKNQPDSDHAGKQMWCQVKQYTDGP